MDSIKTRALIYRLDNVLDRRDCYEFDEDEYLNLDSEMKELVKQLYHEAGVGRKMIGRAPVILDPLCAAVEKLILKCERTGATVRVVYVVVWEYFDWDGELSHSYGYPRCVATYPDDVRKRWYWEWPGIWKTGEKVKTTLEIGLPAVFLNRVGFTQE